VGRKGSDGVLIMSVSAVVPEKSRGNKKCDEEELEEEERHSVRVRGVGDSYAEHLTVESYTVIISLQSYSLLLVFHHPLTLSL